MTQFVQIAQSSIDTLQLALTKVVGVARGLVAVPGAALHLYIHALLFTP